MLPLLKIIIRAAICLTPVLALAEVKLPSIFGDHMVLQRDQGIPVWGKAKPAERVAVEMEGKRVETVTGGDGAWRVKLPPFPASAKSLEMRVTGGDNQVVFRDVLIGDVWLCGGQSNMGMGTGAVREAKEIAADANRPTLRFFSVKRQVSFSGLDDCEGEWVVCSPESVLTKGGNKGFSALGYQFGAALQSHLKIPMGLIGCYVGGSNIHAWSSMESLKALPREMANTLSRLRDRRLAREDLPAAMIRYEKKLLPAWEKERAEQQRPLDQWRKDAALAREQNRVPPPRPELAAISKHPQSPDKDFSHATVLFNGMVNPLIPYGIRGVIWYQGESNTYPQMMDEYAPLFAALITDWRKRWERTDLPFLFVQLPNMEMEKQTWPVVREAQRTTLALPATGMAVAIDAGDPVDLHPASKTLIAQRLVLAARAVAYGEDLVYSGPSYSQVQREGGKLRLRFTHTGSGLMIGTSPSPWFKGDAKKPAEHLQAFEVAGTDGVFHAAQAVIDGDAVVVGAEAVKEPKAVRYAWAPDPKPYPNLYNREGLPASPFKAVVVP